MFNATMELNLYEVSQTDVYSYAPFEGQGIFAIIIPLVITAALHLLREPMENTVGIKHLLRYFYPFSVGEQLLTGVTPTLIYLTGLFFSVDWITDHETAFLVLASIALFPITGYALPLGLFVHFTMIFIEDGIFNNFATFVLVTALTATYALFVYGGLAFSSLTTLAQAFDLFPSMGLSQVKLSVAVATSMVTWLGSYFLAYVCYALYNINYGTVSYTFLPIEAAISYLLMVGPSILAFEYELIWRIIVMLESRFFFFCFIAPAYSAYDIDYVIVSKLELFREI